MKSLRLIFLLAVLACLLTSGPAGAQNSQKLSIKSLTFTGNDSFSNKKLEEFMVSRPGGFLGKSYFHRAVFRDDLANLEAFYQNNGYLDVAVIDTQLLIDEKGKSVSITINISEGPLSRAEDIGIFGNDTYSDSTLLSLVKLKPGEPCRRNMIQQSMLDMVSFYANHGYLEASVQPEIRRNTERNTVLIDFTVSEGSQSTVGEVRLTGQEKTNDNVITRELLFDTGEVVSYSKLLGSERTLYMTGLFQSVFIRPGEFLDSATGSRVVSVDLRERESSEFNVAVGYGSIEKAFGRVELTSSNLAGTARKAGIAVSASFIRRAIEGSFTEPWTFGTRLQTDLRSSYEFLEEPGYTLTRLGMRLTVGKYFGRYTKADITYRFENVRLRHVSIDDPPDNLEPHVRSLDLAISKDSRDNLFDPRSGIYLEWSNELAGSFLQGTNTFVRSQVTGKKFLSLGRHTVVASAIDVGWMDYFGGSKEIPLNERFYAGGPTTLRGFAYQRVGPIDRDGDPLGGQFKLVWNVLEVRRAVYKMFGVVGFCDLGNVWNRIGDARLSEMRAAAGVGLRANTPIGIVRLDYGANLSPKSGEAPQQLFFGMGHAF